MIKERYSHDHTLIIPVYSNSPDVERLTDDELFKAFKERVNYLWENPRECANESMAYESTHDFFLPLTSKAKTKDNKRKRTI